MKSTLNIMPESKRFTPRDVSIMPFVSRAFYIMEEWKDIKSYEGLYKISSCGNVYSIKTNKLLKICLANSGYNVVYLNKGGKTKGFLQHRLIALHFIPNPDNKPQINHINGIKTDNSINNLEWCTHSENQIHSFRHLGRVGGQSGRFGKLHHNSKRVIQYNFNGLIINKYDSLMDAHRKTGVNFRNISSVCVGKRQSAGGYIWQYE